jgi:hypothetical protein
MAKIKVIQRYRVTRTTVIDVDDKHEDPIDVASSGDVDLPEWSDERWKDQWDLVEEDFELANEV